MPRSLTPIQGLRDDGRLFLGDTKPTTSPLRSKQASIGSVRRRKNARLKLPTSRQIELRPSLT